MAALCHSPGLGITCSTVLRVGAWSPRGDTRLRELQDSDLLRKLFPQHVDKYSTEVHTSLIQVIQKQAHLNPSKVEPGLRAFSVRG